MIFMKALFCHHGACLNGPALEDAVCKSTKLLHIPAPWCSQDGAELGSCPEQAERWGEQAEVEPQHSRSSRPLRVTLREW